MRGESGPWFPSSNEFLTQQKSANHRKRGRLALHCLRRRQVLRGHAAAWRPVHTARPPCCGTAALERTRNTCRAGTESVQGPPAGPAASGSWRHTLNWEHEFMAPAQRRAGSLRSARGQILAHPDAGRNGCREGAARAPALQVALRHSPRGARFRKVSGLTQRNASTFLQRRGLEGPDLRA